MTATVKTANLFELSGAGIQVSYTSSDLAGKPQFSYHDQHQSKTFTADQIRNLKNAYRVLYRSDLKLADAVQELKSRVATQPELKAFVDFIGESTRSLVR